MLYITLTGAKSGAYTAWARAGNRTVKYQYRNARGDMNIGAYCSRYCFLF